jgi:spoIIIJ-associated protein
MLPEEPLEGELGLLSEAARGELLRILGLMGFAAEAGARGFRDRLIMDIRCPDNALIIGRRGVGLDALELILNLVVRGRGSQAGRPRLIIDAEDYRGRKHLGIIQKAFVLADEALRTRKPQGIPQLTARERQVAREALSQVAGISTRTMGGGALRNVQLIPEGGGPGPLAPKPGAPPPAGGPGKPGGPDPSA